MSRPSNEQPAACRGPSRREVLRVGSLGFLGLGLDDWFRLRARAGPRSGEAAEGQELHPDLAGRRAVAPRHVRPEARRRRPTSGASSSRSRPRSPGLQISEVLPNLAKVMNRVTLIRSMTSPEADHDRAAHHLLTGYRPSPALEYPGLRQRGLQGARGDAGDAAALCRRPRRPDLRARAAI